MKHLIALFRKKLNFLNLTPVLIIFLLMFIFTHPVFSLKNNIHIPFPKKTHIPFQIIGKLLVIQATIANQTGNYIVDTGTPHIMLNSKYFSGGARTSKDRLFNALGGQVSNIETRHADVYIGAFFHANMEVMITDISHIEDTKNIKILGFIGFNFFKNYEVYFDYQIQEIILYELDTERNKFVEDFYYEPPFDTFDVKMNHHFPCLPVRVGETELLLGLDTGSETTLLRKRLKNKLKDQFIEKHKVKVMGFDNNPFVVPFGELPNLKVGELEYPLREVVLADISSYNQELDFLMDGLLGFEFFYRYPIAINFQKKEVYVWSREEEELPLATISVNFYHRPNPQEISEFNFYNHPKFERGRCKRR